MNYQKICINNFFLSSILLFISFHSCYYLINQIHSLQFIYLTSTKISYLLILLISIVISMCFRGILTCLLCSFMTLWLSIGVMIHPNFIINTTSLSPCIIVQIQHHLMSCTWYFSFLLEVWITNPNRMSFS